ncbi:hypothetical protein ACIBL3_30060 [Kribbella sp. NPDC050124]|uniref:Rv1733c family protein n=1 Tax=Kribbella sp. NPDC050124 TaxID=3364114 RepID=UPI0037ABB4FB
MSRTGRRNGELWVLMQARRLGFGRNPLRRRVDRMESAIVLGSILAALLMIPAAAAIGTAVRTASERSAEERRASLTQVQARAVTAAATSVLGGAGQVASLAKVAWNDPAGRPHEAVTSVPIGTKPGSEVTIWIDRSGALTSPPRPPADSAAIGSAVGLTTAMMSWLLIAGLARLAVVPLDRRRLRDWDRDLRKLSWRL